MNIKSVVVIFIAGVGLVGCATPAKSTLDYREPASSKLNNEITINKSYDVVWSNLARQLAKSFFVVNNIEKESRLINVSFSTESPEDYIDCGKTKRVYTKGDEVINYEYDVAAGTTYKYGAGVSKNGAFSLIAYAKRKTNLEGRINIYVAPIGEKTEVSVNTKYIFKVNVSGKITAENMYGQVVEAKELTPSSSTISFNTNRQGKSGEGITCTSKGLLEKEILTMVRKI